MIEYDMAIYGWDEYHHQTLGSSALLQSCFPLSSIWSAIVSIVFIDSIHMYPWILPDQDDESLVLPPVRSLPGVLGGNSGVSPAQWESSVISADMDFMWISSDFIIWFFTIFQSGFSIAIFWCLSSWPKSTIALASIQDVKLSGWSISGVKVLRFSRSFGSIASNDQRNTSISRSFPHFLGISWIILIAQGPLTPATTPREAAEATSGWCFC